MGLQGGQIIGAGDEGKKANGRRVLELTVLLEYQIIQGLLGMFCWSSLWVDMVVKKRKKEEEMEENRDDKHTNSPCVCSCLQTGVGKSSRVCLVVSFPFPSSVTPVACTI